MLRLLRLPRLLHRHRAERVSTPLIAVALGLALLTGCAEEESAPKFEAEPSVVPSTEPAAASPKNETFKEFIVRWAEVESNMQNTGETSEYQALSEGCFPCEELIKTVKKIYGDGGYIRTNAMEVERVKRITRSGPRQKADKYQVWAQIPPTEYRESSSGAEKSFSGGPQSYLVYVIRTGGRFKLVGLSRTPR